MFGQKEEDGVISARQLITDIRNKNDPNFTMKAIARGWSTNSIPYDEVFLKEYIKAAVATKKFDGIDLSALISDYSGVARTGVNSSLAAAAGGGAGLFAAGSSSANPLHVATIAPKNSIILTLLKYGFLFFVGYAVLNGLSDSVGGSGGLSSKITGAMKGAVHEAENPDKTFDDVVGVDEAKAELQEIVMYLKEPQRFTRLGGRLPKGVLLTGPPGTGESKAGAICFCFLILSFAAGKTLLAKAIAGEAGVPFFYTSGSEFEEMFVGVGARRVRDLFEAAKAKAPCIIFIDEVDAIGGSRHLKDQSTMKMTLNQLLVEMDGFEQNNGIVVIAATNFPDSLDNALTRPGRLDKHVDVPLPDIGGRTAILNLYGSKVGVNTPAALL